MDDFDFIFDNFTESDFNKAETLRLNYGIDMETLKNIFSAKKFNWEG